MANALSTLSLSSVEHRQRRNPLSQETVESETRSCMALGLFNRVQHDRKRCDLDKALVEAFDNLGVPVKNINYMLAIDADTRISVPSICHMVYKMNTQTGILACCGETKVDNKTASWVSMIQVYEYVIACDCLLSILFLSPCVLNLKYALQVLC
jgi:hypothetical protein